MKKELKIILKKLKKYHISSLSAKELTIYFHYRLNKLLINKIVLVKNELEYLFGETGPGNLRIDPELVNLLAKENTFIKYPAITELKKILNRKQEIENFINKEQNSTSTQNFFIKIFNNYLQNIKIISKNPFIIEGQLYNTPLSILIKNGEWIMPNTKLFSFLKNCQANMHLPIIISKKIHGALFPVFKNLSVIGYNTYKIYIPPKIKLLINKIIKPNEKPMLEISYNNQFEFINKELFQTITDEYWEGEPIKSLFENILNKNIENYYTNFIQLKYQIKNNFIETVSQFRKNKINKSLIHGYKYRMAIIQELKRSK